MIDDIAGFGDPGLDAWERVHRDGKLSIACNLWGESAALRAANGARTGPELRNFRWGVGVAMLQAADGRCAGAERLGGRLDDVTAALAADDADARVVLNGLEEDDIKGDAAAKRAEEADAEARGEVQSDALLKADGREGDAGREVCLADEVDAALHGFWYMKLIRLSPALHVLGDPYLWVG